MKILRLDLFAFGPFTNLSLDLAADGEGLHLLYGPNEAGKSSALRALRQMLYGIPARSPDDFIHPYKKMRVGGVLQHSDGTVMEVIRRKGNVNTLRDGRDERPVDETRFARFLGGIDQDVFATMFGIGHQDLVRGGEEITQGGGDMGQALFAAGSGISHLRRVQTALQAEAEALFTPAASTREINRALSAFRDTRKALREAQLPGQEWERHDTALRKAMERRQELDLGLQARETEQHRLERIREALPLISKRQDRLEERAGLVDAVLLPEDFGERRSQLLRDLQVAESGRDQAREDLEETVKALSQLRVDHTVMDRADRIEALYRELGGVQKAERDRGKLEDRRDILWSEAREILSGLHKELSLDQAETLRPERSRTVRIQELGKQYERLMERLESARASLPRLESRIQALEADLDSIERPVDTGTLEQALARAAPTAALEDHRLVEEEEIAGARRSLERALNRQTLWKGSLEALDRLPLPSFATIDALDRSLEETGDAVSRLQSESRDEEQALSAAEGGLKGLELEGEVPAEEDLEAARTRRDSLWACVRRALETGGRPDTGDTAETLEESYELSVRKADELADRLRREADRVARKAKLVSDRESLKERLARLKHRLARAEAERDEAAAEWHKAWEPAGVTPRSPREMRGWVQDLQNLLERFASLQERERKARALERDRAACRSELDDCLRALSLSPAEEEESLTDLAARCRRIVEHQERLRNEQDQLMAEKKRKKAEKDEAKARLDKVESDLAEWQSRWEDAVRPLGLGAEALPAQADAVMQDLSALFDKLKEADILHKRVQGIERDGEGYTEKVGSLVKQAAPDLEGGSVEHVVSELHARLNRAREAASRRERMKEQKGRQEARIRKAEERILEMQSALDAMCAEAGCAGYEDLVEAERRSNRLRLVDADLEGLEEQLRGLSAGSPVELFVQEAREVDPDEIDGRLLRLEEDMTALREERTGLDRTIGEQTALLREMDGSPRAARLAEEAQGILAGLERSVETYSRLRLASTILARAVERYRDKHQGPVLERTNALFARLTLGRFAGVRAEYDEQGTPVLMGVRPGAGEIVPVSGMSDGTADQLYLALRLASLEAYLETNEPMPFIVDDILIKFDDDRARAALEALAELSRKTQVIFFTHHRHLLALAENTDGVRSCFLKSFHAN